MTLTEYIGELVKLGFEIKQVHKDIIRVKTPDGNYLAIRTGDKEGVIEHFKTKFTDNAARPNNKEDSE